MDTYLLRTACDVGLRDAPRGSVLSQLIGMKACFSAYWGGGDLKDGLAQAFSLEDFFISSSKLLVWELWGVIMWVFMAWRQCTFAIAPLPLMMPAFRQNMLGGFCLFLNWQSLDSVGNHWEVCSRLCLILTFAICSKRDLYIEQCLLL